MEEVNARLIGWFRRSVKSRFTGISFDGLALHLSKGEKVFLVLLTLGLACVYLLGINSWKFALIGDENSFFFAADAIVEEGFFAKPWSYWIKMAGVYGDVPTFVTGYQALFLKIFGRSSVGWKMSSTFLTLLCVLPLYLMLRHVLAKFSRYPKISAAFGCAVFFLSEMIIVWARIGKPCNAALVTPVFAVLFFFAAKRSKWFYLLAGMICGFGLYLFILGPTVAIANLGVLMLVRIIAEWKESRKRLWLPPLLMTVGFLIVAAPALMQTDFFVHSFAKHVKGYTIRPKGNQVLFTLDKLGQTLALPYTFHARSHFLYGGVIDPATAFLIPFALVTLRRKKGMEAFFVMIGLYVTTAFITGGIDKYPQPTETRVFVMMLPISFAAAAGFDALFVWNRRRLAVALAVVLGVLIGAYNWGKLELYNPYFRAVGAGMLMVQRIQERPSDRTHVFIFPRRERPFLERQMKVYGYLDRVVLMEDSKDTPARLEGILKDLNASDSLARVTLINARGNLTQIREVCKRYQAILDPPLPKAGVPRRPPGIEADVFRRIRGRA